jgi:hypothetical protein
LTLNQRRKPKRALASAYPEHRFVDARGFWECKQHDGARSRIVIDLA